MALFFFYWRLSAFVCVLWHCLTAQGYTLKGRPEDSGEVFWKAAMRADSYIRVASTSSVTRWEVGGRAASWDGFISHLYSSLMATAAIIPLDFFLCSSVHIYHV